MVNVFLVNIKPYNWDECRKRAIFGLRKGAFHPEFKEGDIFLIRLSGTKPNYGVKAIWYFKSERTVEDPSDVPWDDAEYVWILYCSVLIEEFEDFFMENFEGKSKYSEKIKLNAGRLIGAIIQLRPKEIVNYLSPFLSEKSNELKVSAEYLGKSINVYNLLSNIILDSKKNITETKEKIPLAQKISDYVGDPINFRGIVYAPLNEAGVILLFSRVMEDLGIFYEASPSSSFPDMIGRIKTESGLKKVYIEFEFQSRNFLQHGHLKKMEEGVPCDYLVCWEHNWLDCPVDVIELREVIEELV